jgi:hypothetical protein
MLATLYTYRLLEKPAERRMALVFIFKLLMDYIHVICVYAEDGFYAGACVTSILVAFSGFAWGLYLVLKLLYPLIHGLGQVQTWESLNKFIKISFVVFQVLFSAVAFASLGYVYDDADSRVFNILIITALLLMGSYVLLLNGT